MAETIPLVRWPARKAQGIPDGYHLVPRLKASCVSKGQRAKLAAADADHRQVSDGVRAQHGAPVCIGIVHDHGDLPVSGYDVFVWLRGIPFDRWSQR